MAPPPFPSDYPALLIEIKTRIHSAQYEALRAVNKELLALYWDLGRLIVERQAVESWGSAVVRTLAKDLQSEFTGIQGLSARNLFRMKELYLAHGKTEKVPPLVAQIGWSHNWVIVEKCEKADEREFYLRMTHCMGWSKNVLLHQIENQAFEKTLASQNNFAAALPAPMRQQAQLALKDEYTFDFLELGDEHSERQLESAILSRVEPFLREMGGVFSFIASQFRLAVSEKEYFIDLLLYHRHLKALVALELKTGEFLPEYVGKMQFYLAVLDDKVRLPEENPSIGIVLCKSKHKTIVEYALRESKKPIGVGAYQIHRTPPPEMKGQLPEPEQLARLLDAGRSDSAADF